MTKMLVEHSSIRIIAGSLRGRKIKFSCVDGLRPTLDRIRETLFNWLQPYIVGARCLDLFAGTGAFAFESISRGAEYAVLLENNNTLYNDLLENANRFAILEQCRILHQSFSEHLVLDAAPFDIVFLDPPFDSNYLQQASQWLLRHNLLHADSIVYIEAATAMNLQLPQEFRQIKSKSSKHIQYGLWQLF